jgi:hypothetical protein
MKMKISNAVDSSSSNSNILQRTGNYTIKYSYTLESDNARYVLFGRVYDFSLLTYVSYWVAYASVIFGVLVLIHSHAINKRNMNFVRYASDLSAFFSVIFSVMFLISAYRPNKTKTAIAWDLCAVGVSQVTIQLCDSYLFVNRYRAIRKMHRFEQWFTHLYIFVVIALPYNLTSIFLPLFINTNDVRFDKLREKIRDAEIWGTIAYNIYFTLCFAGIGYSFIRKTNQQSNNLKWIVIKSLCHCVTSSIANILLFYSNPDTYFFDYAMYNMMIMFGIHFLFNFKIEHSSLMRRLFVKKISKLELSNSRRSEIYNNRMIQRNLNLSTKSKKIVHVKQYSSDDDVYLDKLQTWGVKKSILYSFPRLTPRRSRTNPVCVAT